MNDEPPAVDRERAVRFLAGAFMAQESVAVADVVAECVVQKMVDSGILLDAAAVRREAEHHIPEQCADSRCPICICVAAYVYRRSMERERTP